MQQIRKGTGFGTVCLGEGGGGRALGAECARWYFRVYALILAFPEALVHKCPDGGRARCRRAPHHRRTARPRHARTAPVLRPGDALWPALS